MRDYGPCQSCGCNWTDPCRLTRPQPDWFEDDEWPGNYRPGVTGPPDTEAGSTTVDPVEKFIGTPTYRRNGLHLPPSQQTPSERGFRRGIEHALAVFTATTPRPPLTSGAPE